MKTIQFYTSLIRPFSFFAICSLFLFTTTASAQYPAGSPVAVNGRLKVSSTHLVNECGNTVQLRGMSSHGVQWFGSCYNDSSIHTLASDWGADVFRIAMYVQEGGYINNPSYWKAWIDNMVAICAARGIYCIIDWHVLNPGDPNANLTEAKDFWNYMSAKHAADKNVLYEICNEPNGVSWATVKSFANTIIPIIRANDPNTVIICGTPTWSQDVDVAAADPLSFSNVMYALHFYSGTHTQYLRDKGNTAIARGAALFVSECGTSTASGDGGPYLTEMQTWIDWMATNTISWINWNFSDKSETSAALLPGVCASQNWNNTSASGTFIKQHILSPADNFVCGTSNASPVVNLTSPVNGKTFAAPAIITLQASASDADGTIKSVAFYNGNTLLNTDMASPYSYTWKNVGTGTYNLTARATDNKGAVTISSIVTVTVSSTSNKAPTVRITAPANGKTYMAPATITIRANAADADGTIKSVAFYNGSSLLATDIDSPYTYTWKGVSAGSYLLTAVATDDKGASATSAAVSVSVSGGTAAGSLKVQYKTTDASAGTSTLRPLFQIVNVGSAAVPLSELTLRYWYTNDGAASQNWYCDWAAAGCGNIKPKFVSLTNTVSGANNYLEIGFASGSLAANSNSGEIQDRVAKNDWSNYTQTGDYSFDGSKTSFADWNKVTLYRNGVLVWGTEPSGASAKETDIASSSLSSKDNFEVLPNPAKDHLRILYSALRRENVMVALYGTAGAKLMESAHTVQKGENTMQINVSALPAGLYSVIITRQEGNAVVKKVQIVR